MTAPVQDLLACVLAIALDAALRLPNALHPVAWFGSLAGALIRRAPAQHRWAPGLVGLVLGIGLPLMAAGLAALLLSLCARSPLPAATSIVVKAWLLSASFTLAGLLDAGKRLALTLRDQDLPAARARLGWLCSRDASALDTSDLACGGIESLAENLSDSVVAPLTFALTFGVPGAVAYRALNTLDAMIGYHGRYEWLGKASARLDDLANLVPARLTAALLLLAGATLRKQRQVDLMRGLRVFGEDRKRTESPNAGRPMAMAAGLLGVRLDKPGHYVLGDTLAPPRIDDLERCLVLVRRAGLLGLSLVCAIARLHGLGGLHGAR